MKLCPLILKLWRILMTDYQNPNAFTWWCHNTQNDMMETMLHKSRVSESIPMKLSEVHFHVNFDCHANKRLQVEEVKSFSQIKMWFFNKLNFLALSQIWFYRYKGYPSYNNDFCEVLQLVLVAAAKYPICWLPSL